jgi:hypothetical protein
MQETINGLGGGAERDYRDYARLRTELTRTRRGLKHVFYIHKLNELSQRGFRKADLRQDSDVVRHVAKDQGRDTDSVSRGQRMGSVIWILRI